MIDIRNSILILILAFFLSIGCASAATVTNADTGESMTCDGNSDQVEINSMIYSASAGDVIELEGDFKIDKTITMKSGITLQGVRGAKITADPEAFQYSAAALILLPSVSNVQIRNLTINGGEPDTATQHENGGHSWGNAIVLTGTTSSCKFENIYFTRLDGDAIRATGSTEDIIVENCTMKFTGHDGVQCWGGSNWEVTNCTMDLFINSGVRYANTEDSIIRNCEFYCDTNSGFCGVELEDKVSGINIRDNYFHDIDNSYSVGIATVHASGDINVYNNTFKNLNGGAMRVSGVTVTEENNLVYSSSDDSGEVEAPEDNDTCENNTTCEDSEEDSKENSNCSIIDDYEFGENCSNEDDYEYEDNCTETEDNTSCSVNTEYSFDVIKLLTGNSIKNMALANEMINSSSSDVEQAAALKEKRGYEDVVNHLINESQVKEEYARTLFEMSLEDLDMSRKMVNASK